MAISLSAAAQYADGDIIVKRGKLYCDGIQLSCPEIGLPIIE
jgi:hypothetical protein